MYISIAGVLIDYVSAYIIRKYAIFNLVKMLVFTLFMVYGLNKHQAFEPPHDKKE